jgi:RimJ/RimL family protein N-acetyltransferase
VQRLVGDILPDNRAMLRLCHKVGFRLYKPLGEEVTAEMMLEPIVRPAVL